MLLYRTVVNLLDVLAELVVLVFDLRVILPQLLHLLRYLLPQHPILILHDLSVFKLVLVVIFQGPELG